MVIDIALGILLALAILVFGGGLIVLALAFISSAFHLVAVAALAGLIWWTYLDWGRRWPVIFSIGFAIGVPLLYYVVREYFRGRRMKREKWRNQ